MNMYNDLIDIAIDFNVSRLQSYDNISKVVSVAYGKNRSKMKMEIVNNQQIMNYYMSDPMENFFFLSSFRTQKQQILFKR